MNVSLKDFDAQLSNHDWYYCYSDDHSVYKAGRAAEAQIQLAAETSEQHKKLMEAWTKYSIGEKRSTRQELDVVRIEVEVTSQEELDAAIKARENARLEAAKEDQQRLRNYFDLCSKHDWSYWNNQIETGAYKVGFEQRRKLLEGKKYGSDLGRFERIFKVWAAYRTRNSGQEEKQRVVELAADLKIDLQF